MRRILSFLLKVVALLVLGVALAPWASSSGAKAADNPIETENQLPGTTAWLLTKPAYANQISGFPTRESVRPGHYIGFAVRTLEPTFSASIYRVGWYGGKGARLMKTYRTLHGHAWSLPTPDPQTGLLVCHWPVSFRLKVPLDWISGIYLVKLTDSRGWQQYIPFTVVEATPESSLLFVDTVTTSEAYNTWGGKSLYPYVSTGPKGKFTVGPGVEVSFLRPFSENAGAGLLLSWEIHCIRWLEKEGYWVSYATDLDVNNDPSVLEYRKGIIIAGHDEYWSWGMREAYAKAVANGVGLANLGANTGYWQIRFQSLEPNDDAIEICYRSSTLDPDSKTDPVLTTVNWRSPPVNLPESELLGAMYGNLNGHQGPYPWVITDAGSSLFHGTGVTNGASVSGLVGYEDDYVVLNFPVPAGLQVLATSPIVNINGNRRISNSTVYTSTSGATVFNAGTIGWSYGLDDFPVGYPPRPLPRTAPSAIIERVTANVLRTFLVRNLPTG